MDIVILMNQVLIMKSLLHQMGGDKSALKLCNDLDSQIRFTEARIRALS